MKSAVVSKKREATVGTPWREDSVFLHSFAPQPSAAATLRSQLVQYLSARHVDDATISSILLCADEAFINAVQHAPDTSVAVFAEVHDDSLTLDVTDGGPGFDPAAVDHDATPDLDAEHGRGLFLIRQLADEFRIFSGRKGTTLHMGLALRAA